MRFASIASGSSGNSTYIGSDKTHILIDAGVSSKRIVTGLHSFDIKPEINLPSIKPPNISAPNAAILSSDSPDLVPAK